MYEYKAKAIRVVDGDTVVLRIDVGFHVFVEHSCRILGIDTPETHRPKSEGEKSHGLKATARAIDLLVEEDLIIKSSKAGKYGRFLVQITLPDGRDYTETMISEGFEKKKSYAKEDE